MYCNIMKLFNLLIVLFVVSYIIYFAYLFFSPSLKLKKRR
jgi:hypothetical protein